MYCAAMHLETTWIYHIRTKFLLIPGKQAHSSFYADAFSFKRTCDFVHDRKKLGLPHEHHVGRVQGRMFAAPATYTLLHPF